MGERLYGIPVDAAATVRRRLAEAAAWCCSRIALDNSLRTPELQPERPFVSERGFPDGTNHHEYLDTVERAAQVERVVELRAGLFSQHGIAVNDTLDNQLEGQLLVAEIDNSVWDGLSEAESKQFFDVYDIPAWDTWVDLRRAERTDVLLCWVPSPLIELVNNGIYVNCTDCVGWVDRLVISDKFYDA